MVNHDGSQFADVYIEDGIVKQIGNHLIIPGGTRVIDAFGKLVIPGGIDPNVHFQTPVSVKSTQTRTIDDFYVGTKAALAGGTTTVIQLIEPQNPDQNSLQKELENWQLWAEEKACCDYAFKMKLPPSFLASEAKNEIREMSRENQVNCFVVSMEDFADEDLIEFFELCSSTGKFSNIWSSIHTRAKIRNLSENSHYENIIFQKIHYFKISFFTKFTFSMFYFSQNSHFSKIKFLVISGYKDISWFLPRCDR